MTFREVGGLLGTPADATDLLRPDDPREVECRLWLYNWKGIYVSFDADWRVVHKKYENRYSVHTDIQARFHNWSRGK